MKIKMQIKEMTIRITHSNDGEILSEEVLTEEELLSNKRLAPIIKEFLADSQVAWMCLLDNKGEEHYYQKEP